MEGDRRRALLVGLGGAILVFVGLFVVVGADRVLESLLAADPAFVAATFALGLCWLGAWSLMLRTVLAGLGVRMSIGRAFFVYAGAVFANNVTPFGQAGGEPVAALLVSKTTNARYETGLAGITTVDVCNVVPSVSLAIVGVGYYATTAAVSDRIEAAFGVAIALVVAIVVGASLLWRAREAILDRIPTAIATLVARVGGDRIDRETVETELAERLRRFFDNLHRVATDRRRLAVVVGLSLTGWLFQAVALLAAFAAVGYSVPVAVVLLAIPLANLAGAAPLPGGLGGIEAAFVGLLAPTTGVPVAAVTAAVLIFRGAVYWLPVLIGGSSTAAFGVLTAT